MIFTDQASFDETVANYGVLTIYYATYNMLDYAYIDHTNASDIRYYLSAFSKADEHFPDRQISSGSLLSVCDCSARYIVQISSHRPASEVPDDF